MEFKDKIIKNLSTQFPEFEIYGKKVRQGFKIPAITVFQTKKYIKKQMNHRYIFSYTYDIECFANKFDELLENRLICALDNIDYQARASEFELIHIDGKIKISVVYSIVQIIEQENFNMQKMEAKIIEKRN